MALASTDEIQAFYEELQENLAFLDKAIISLEENPQDRDQITEIFRVAHTTALGGLYESWCPPCSQARHRQHPRHPSPDLAYSVATSLIQGEDTDASSDVRR